MNALNNTDQMTMVSESLPFRVEIASGKTLMDVASLRAASYGKHLPALGTKLSEPESSDFDLGCEVFVARSKLDGGLLGTFRTHANVFKALPLESSLRLPHRLTGTRMVETTRLCVKANPNASVVRSALFKALHLYCVAQEIDWMMAAGRRPVDRIYDGLQFKDVDEAGKFYPMEHAGGIPHRVMNLAPNQVAPMWAASKHPLYDFFFKTSHLDIDLSQAKRLNNLWENADIEALAAHFPERRLTPRPTGHLTASSRSLAA